MKTPTPQNQLNDLIKSAPLDIQRRFGCDCAERALDKDFREDTSLLEALKTVRQHIDGCATDKDLLNAHSIATNVFYKEKQTEPERVYRVAEVVAHLCRPDPRITFVQQLSLWCIATSAVYSSSSQMEKGFLWHETWNTAYSDEFKWQKLHLCKLLDQLNST